MKKSVSIDEVETKAFNSECSSLLPPLKANGFDYLSMQRWLPSQEETPFTKMAHHTPSLRRRIFLVLTEPDTSTWSAVFFFVLILAIVMSNVIMIMQTMDAFQFVPTDCVSCGGTVSYIFEDDAFIEEEPPGVKCVCPPSPLRWMDVTLNWLIYFLTVEWILRVAMFSPADPAPTSAGRMVQWFQFLMDSSTLIDALAIFPYYLEQLPNGLVSLRIFRLLRIFQLVRLGQYNQAFTSLTNVLSRSVQYLRLLIIVLAFGAAFFGSMVYWMEKGTWKYHEPSGEYTFVRVGLDGKTEEPTPFESIPVAFWWFFVTATTVGYGDMYPTSTLGRYVAVLAMLMGVLVIAFPVSVFSELWDQELSNAKGFDHNIHQDTLYNNKNGGLSENDEKEEVPCSGSLLKEIVLSTTDVQEIMTCLETIRERERRISDLLQRAAVNKECQ